MVLRITKVMIKKIIIMIIIIIRIIIIIIIIMIIIKTTNNTGTNDNIRSLVTYNFLKINKWINEQIKQEK